MPYAIGVYYEDKYKCFYLTDYENTYYMFKDFLLHVSKSNIKRLYAHNGGKFDFRLVLEYAEKPVTKEFVRGNIIYSFTLNINGHRVTFNDSLLLLNSSLKTLCKNFNTETIKGIFPHRFVNRERLE